MRSTLDTAAFHAALPAWLSDSEMSVILAAIKNRRNSTDPGQEELDDALHLVDEQLAKDQAEYEASREQEPRYAEAEYDGSTRAVVATLMREAV